MQASAGGSTAKGRGQRPQPLPGLVKKKKGETKQEPTTSKVVAPQIMPSFKSLPIAIKPQSCIPQLCDSTQFRGYSSIPTVLRQLLMNRIGIYFRYELRARLT